MNHKKYLIEQRVDGKITTFDKKPGFEAIMGLDGVNIDKLLVFANNYEDAWYENEYGHMVGNITPQKIDGWLKHHGLERRHIYWK
jgi:hypothetical protein